MAIVKEVFVNSGGAQTINGNVWAAGSPTNGGTSRTDAYDSANDALDNVTDGTRVIFANGTYSYTNGTGRWITSANEIELAVDEDWKVTLAFDGSQAQGIRWNGDAAGGDAKFLTIGKMLITPGSNTAKTNLIVPTNNSAGDERMTINMSGRLIPHANPGGTQYGILVSCTDFELNWLDGGIANLDGSEFDGSAATSEYRPFYIGGSLAAADGFILNIEKCALNFRSRMANAGAVFWVDFDASPDWSAVSQVKVSGLTGSVTNTHSTADGNFCYVARINNAGPNVQIVDNNNLNVTSTAKGQGLFCIDGDDQDGDGCTIARNKNIKVTSASGSGNLLAYGDETTVTGSSGTDECTIVDNDVEFITSDQSNNTCHGVSFFGCSNGLAAGNRIKGARLPLLLKYANAKSLGNVYEMPVGANAAALYAKGASAGGLSDSDILLLPDGYEGDAIQSLDGNSPPDGTDPAVDFKVNNLTIKMISGQPASSFKLMQIGDNTTPDDSDAQINGINVDENIDLSALTSIADIYSTSYTTLSSLNGLSVTQTGGTTTVDGVVSTDVSTLAVQGSGSGDEGRKIASNSGMITQ